MIYSQSNQFNSIIKLVKSFSGNVYLTTSNLPTSQNQIVLLKHVVRI